MHELPAKHQIVAILGNSHQLQQAKKFLLLKEYRVITCLLDTEELWQKTSEIKLLETGCHSVPLWQANPFLTEVIDLIEEHVSGRTAIDIACGAGRDSVFLAQRGWQVTAIDNKSSALARCKSLALAAKVDVTTLLRELEQQPQPLMDLSADLVVIMRYLHRPLFTDIDALMGKGGALVYSTFMVGCEKFGSPRNPNYLLKPGELAQQFSTYEILMDEQRELADGRPVALFVALKS